MRQTTQRARAPKSPRARVLLTSVFTAALLHAAACGGTDTSADPLFIGDAAATVEMDGSQFAPGNLQVPAGATITFANRDSATHDARADDKSWQTDKLSNGESEQVRFDDAGEWTYICTVHPSMKARITVVDEVAETEQPLGNARAGT